MKWVKNGAALVLGMGVAIGLAELGLRIGVPLTSLLDPTREAFWLYRSELQLAGGGVSADTIADLALGWRMRPSYRAPGISHDSKGFRGPHEVTPHGPGPRILVIGDSFTYGLGVADHETYAAYLAELRGVEVVNAGVNAYGVDQALLMWELEGRRLAPQVVVLGYFVDDFHRDGLSVRDRAKPRFAFDPSGHLVLHTPEESLQDSRRQNPSEAVVWRLPLAIDMVRRKVRSRLGLLDDELLRSRAEMSEALLRRLKDSVAEAGAKLLVVFIGHHHQGARENLWIETSVLRSCEKVGAGCLNLAAAMRGPDWDLYYGPNGHFSALGHRFAAARIADALGPVAGANDGTRARQTAPFGR